MRRFLLMLQLVMIMALMSCEVDMPENVIPPGKMEVLLYDYHLVQSMGSEYAASDYKEKLFYEYVFEKHNVTKERFDSSMMWYNRYPKHLKKLYTSLEARLEAEVESLNASGGVLDTGVSLDMVYLAADTAELWTGQHNRIFYSSMLNSHMAFDFTAPDDSSFMAGDSISFSFDALFVNEGRDSIRQRAYAGVLVRYADGTSDNLGIEILRSGRHALELPRNMESRLELMDGFVYYSDNDSLSKAKLMLSDISLKKFSAKNSGETEEKK